MLPADEVLQARHGSQRPCSGSETHLLPALQSGGRCRCALRNTWWAYDMHLFMSILLEPHDEARKASLQSDGP